MNWEYLKFLFFSSKGNITRKEYWLGIVGIMLFNIISILTIVMISSALQNESSDPSSISIVLIFAIAMIAMYAHISIVVKRFHDIGMSGWFTLLILIPYIGFLVDLIIGFIPSVKDKTQEKNENEAEREKRKQQLLKSIGEESYEKK